jgi:hypothetical protein
MELLGKYLDLAQETYYCSGGQSPASRFVPRSGYVGFMFDKVALGQVFTQYFCFPCEFSIPPATQCIINIVIIPGWYNKAICGRRTKWTKSHHTPRIKKIGPKINVMLTHLST